MASTNMSTPAYSMTREVERTEQESGLWFFMSAPISFVVTLLIVVYLSQASF